MDVKNIIFLLGGFAGGCFFMKKYLKADMERQLDEAYRKMDEDFQNEYSAEEKQSESGPSEMAFERSDLKVFRSELKKQAYDSYFKSDKDVEEDDREPEGPSQPPIDASDDYEPRIISYEQFSEDRRNEKQDLIYYTEMDLLVEENEIQENLGLVVGEVELKAEKPNEEGYIYVRNNRLGVDYAIFYDDSDAGFVRKTLGMDG